MCNTKDTAYGHEVHCYHIFDIQYQDGRSEDMDSNNVEIKEYPIDWELIYELSDSITTTQKSK